MRKSAVAILLLFLLAGFSILLYGVRLHYSGKIKQARLAEHDQRIISNELISCQFQNWQTAGITVPERKLRNLHNGQELTLHELLAGRQLLVYVDYKMCKPCVRHNLEMIDSLFLPTHKERTSVVIYTPGGNDECGLDFSGIQSNIWLTGTPLEKAFSKTGTPCFMYTEQGVVSYAYHSTKNTDVLLHSFHALAEQFFR